MAAYHLSLLEDRGVVSVSGPDARDFLDNLITNDMALLDAVPAIHAALLTPQGKILFAFFVVRAPDGYLLDTLRTSVADLVKRLTLYRLRAKVTLNDLSSSRTVAAVWGAAPPSHPLALVFPDPRREGMGHRLLMPPEIAEKYRPEDEGAARYAAHRISLCVPDAGADYALGDTFPHEADFDCQHGVSFTKGCFVGQEVVARMQHKTVVRKRIVAITAERAIASGAGIDAGTATIGKVGSVAGTRALALVRLDRALEAAERDMPLIASGARVEVEPEALRRYAAAASGQAQS